MDAELHIDAFPPAKMASRMEEVGVAKSKLRLDTMLALAILAGAFIGTGAIFATMVTTGLVSSVMGFGLIKLIGGLVFCLGLIAVVVAGAELFTGNNLVIMAYASRRIKLGALVRNWIVVYIGNFIGSIATAFIMLLTKQYAFSNGALGANAGTDSALVWCAVLLWESVANDGDFLGRRGICRHRDRLGCAGSHQEPHGRSRDTC